MDSPYKVTRLRNGARIATMEMPHMRSATVGIWAGVGGRHESKEECGVSHFIEHLLFKGTKKRTSRQLTTAVEGVGGYLNAFTTEDHTCFYAKAGANHFHRLCDVLGDMYVDSTFPEIEINRERDVIREEIMMYRDQPGQHVQELLTATLWPDHPLGRPLTGTVETIAKFKRKQLLEYLRTKYSGANTVVTVAGAVTHQQAVEELRSALERLPAGKRPRAQRAPKLTGKPLISLHTQETEQTHLAMGFHAWGRDDDRRFALKLLSVILGENMSSRLFQKLREHHGYCYSVQTGMVVLSDTGAFHISAGLDSAKLEKALRMIMKELETIATRGPGKAELQMAKDYTVGQTLMGLESTTSQLMWMGESLLSYNRVLCPQEVEKRILAVTVDEIKAVAHACLNRSRLGVAVIGPVKSASELRRWLS